MKLFHLATYLGALGILGCLADSPTQPGDTQDASPIEAAFRAANSWTPKPASRGRPTCRGTWKRSARP